MKETFSYLIENISGEVYHDELTLTAYATDASLYQIKPDLIVVPKNETDVLSALKFASQHQIPVLGRGSATSLAGQTVNKGMVIDFTKYFNKIITIDSSQKYAIVQPGVTRDQLNTACQKYNLHFAPDPATTSRATIGGMIANNSSGTRSILYGMTSHHVLELKIATITGEVFTVKECSEVAYNEKCKQANLEGEIYRSVREIIFENYEEIKSRYPKTLRRVGGYALDSFVDDSNWNLAQLITGSEGTLAMILEAKVNLSTLPSHSNMVFAHFDLRKKAIDSVESIVKFGPAAVELLDYNVLRQSKLNIITKAYYDSVIVGEPDAILFIEFFGNTLEEINHKAQEVINYLSSNHLTYHCYTTTDKKIIGDSQALRRAGLGIIMGVPGMQKPLPFMEDAAVPLPYLSKYVEQVEHICGKYQVPVVLYAHASVGVLHIRPSIDLTHQAGIDLMKTIAEECYTLVKSYGGSWTSEHGDGRDRSPFLLDFYGENIYNAFRKIKKLFDKDHLLNPNIIIDYNDMRKDMRYYDGYKDQDYPFVYKYRNQANFHDMVHNCTGVGVCRNTLTGTMCPSYRASAKELDTTRSRANVLRLAMSGQMQFENLTHENVTEVLDLCLSCKACKSDCPSNVDMAKLKSEVLQINYDKKGKKLSQLLPFYSSSLSRSFSGWPSKLVNAILAYPFIKKLNEKWLGVDVRRPLPKYANQSLYNWFRKEKKKRGKVIDSDLALIKVGLFADTYINFHETAVGKHAIALLGKLGCAIHLIDVGCCQRPKISNGFLKEAKKELEELAHYLNIFIDEGMKILVVEPSCATALMDDLPDLIDDEALGKKIKENVLPIESFILDRINQLPNNPLKSKKEKYVLHGHCHQKAIYSTKDSIVLLQQCGAEVEEINSTCCGMAGAFGYEKKHYEMSETLGKKLVNQINNSNCDHVIANGYSCRHQLNDMGGIICQHVIMELE